MRQFIKFITKCIAVCVGAIFLLFLLNARYEQVMDNPYSDANKFNFMNSIYKDIQICNIGSSHGEYAFYYEELSKQEGYECFNFAMASQTYNYDYAVLSMYKDHFADNSILFIPVSYFSFNNEVANESEQEFLSAKYYTFLSPKYIPDYDPYVDVVVHYMPILSAGKDIWKILPSLSLKVFAAGPEDFQQKALNRYSRHMDGKEEYFMQERIDNLYDILNFCKDNGITAVLITTPYTVFYSDLFSDDFKEEFNNTITTIAASTNTSYYNYSEDQRFADKLDYFSDADHLNTDGSIYFMNIIKEEIPEFQEFLLHNEPNHVGDPDWDPPA